ncbi:MAG: hypothetical protein FJ297_12275 [Planctomycetes bacterium]|nr:hypothetical protein [Planctomycetota bacterium]
MKQTFSNRRDWFLVALILSIFTLRPGFGDETEPAAGDRRDSIVLEAARNVAGYPVVEARVRQYVHLLGREWNGSGTYGQARIDNKLRLRYELRLPLGERSTHMRQINDGDYVWLHREWLDGPELTVIDLRRARLAVSDEPRIAARLDAVGGLFDLLHGIHEHFDFDDPREGTLDREPVWIVDGRWRSGVASSEASTEGPQCPQSVRLMLSRGTVLPLFPFRIEYTGDRSAPAASRAVAEAVERGVIMRIEFFEVRVRGTPDPRSFTFAAGDQAFRDVTDEFIASLR